MWTLPATLVHLASQALMFIVIARLGSPGQVGRFGLALAIAGPIYMFFSLRMRAILAADQAGKYDVSEYFLARIGAIFLAACITMVVASAAGCSVVVLRLVFVMCLLKSVDSLADLMAGLLQNRGYMDRLSISITLHSISSFVAFSLTFYHSGQVYLGVLAAAAARLVVLLGYDFPHLIAAIEHRPRLNSEGSIFRSERIIKLYWNALPLGITALLVSVYSSLPKIIISQTHGEYELGILCGLMTVMVAGTTFLRALELSSAPRLAKLFIDRSFPEFWRLLTTLLLALLGFGLLSTIASILVGRPALHLLFGSEYAEYADVLPILMIGLTISLVVGMIESAMVAAGLRKVQPLLNAITAFCCLFAALILIPSRGITGAAIALAVGRLPYLLFGMSFLSAATRRAGDTRPTSLISELLKRTA